MKMDWHRRFEERIRVGAKRSFLYWVVLARNRNRQGALLVDVTRAPRDTPEGFYWGEMEYRSTLLERAEARGLVRENQESDKNKET